MPKSEAASNPLEFMIPFGFIYGFLDFLHWWGVRFGHAMTSAGSEQLIRLRQAEDAVFQQMIPWLFVIPSVLLLGCYFWKRGQESVARMVYGAGVILAGLHPIVLAYMLYRAYLTVFENGHFSNSIPLKTFIFAVPVTLFILGTAAFIFPRGQRENRA